MISRNPNSDSRGARSPWELVGVGWDGRLDSIARVYVPHLNRFMCCDNLPIYGVNRSLFVDLWRLSIHARLR